MKSYKTAIGFIGGVAMGIPLGLWLTKTIKNYISFDDVLNLSNDENFDELIGIENMPQIFYVKTPEKIIKYKNEKF
ncbi:hypothetical protein HYZ41_00685 [archaeon]|nr:hypothetical protein [archaeon]